MKNRRAAALCLATLVSIAPGFAGAQTDGTDTFVKGATDFLLDRANDNYVYVFQRKLESNPVLQKYFPETLRIAKAGDIQSLIMHKDLWRDALKLDLVGSGNNLFGRALGEATEYIDRLCKSELDGTAPGAGAKGPSVCGIALLQVGRALDKWGVARGKVCDAKSDKTQAEQLACDDATKQIEDAKARLSSIQQQIPGASAQPAAAAAAPVARTVNPQATSVGFMSAGATQALGDLARDLGAIKPEACADLKAGRYTGCVIEVLYVLEAVSHADYLANCFLYGNWCTNDARDGQNANREESDDYRDFKRYALFFAQLADAVDTSDRARVNALLKSVTIPPVSFGIKREPHATRVLVTAYVGGGWSWKTAAPHQQIWGVVAPVGVEVSQARDSGNSLSLLLSPLDFGYPLTLKLKNADATVKGSDIVVPAAYVFYGWKNYPVAAGVGYSRGRSLDNPDQRVGRVLLLVAFDMPLFRLH